MMITKIYFNHLGTKQKMILTFQLLKSHSKIQNRQKTEII